ncbi:MAG: RNA pyrophosphohydrolase [Lactobacillales bacterium]|nr:RNA pyrophosphohydrolase [Lactobacillales bacterium]
MNNREKLRDDVGIMLVNADKKIFMGYRRSSKKLIHPFQMPQGGISKNEAPEDAMKREIHEEIGLKPESYKIIAQSKNWYTYALPRHSFFRRKGYTGIRQKWFLLLFTGTDEDFSFQNGVYQEFIDFRWVGIEEIVARVALFKRNVYEQVVAEFGPIVADLDFQEK